MIQQFNKSILSVGVVVMRQKDIQTEGEEEEEDEEDQLV